MFLIAQNTIREFLRNKVMYIIVLSAFFLFLLWFFVSQLVLTETNKIFVDFSLFIVEMFALIIVLFFGSTLLFNERKRKTLDIILLKTHNVKTLILGKFLWFASIIWIYFIVMSSIFALSSLFIYFLDWSFLLWSFVALIFSYIKILVILSIVIFFSTFTSSIISICSSLMIYIVSHSIAFIKYSIVSNLNDSNIIYPYIINGLYYIFPNFEQLSIKEYLFSHLINQISWFDFIALIISNALYIFVLLFFSIAVYSRKLRI
jgi:ABC-type transport system involved in multi-copper enzyme maturation permease subunit